MPVDDTIAKAAVRWQECKIMCQAARFQGLDVTQAQVNRFYQRFRAWYEGRLTLSYLIRCTGIQMQGED